MLFCSHNAAHQHDQAPASSSGGFVVPGVCEPGEAPHTPGPEIRTG